MTHFIALAGASGSGKSTLAKEIRRILGPERCVVVSTSTLLRERWRTEGGDGGDPTREQLRDFGNHIGETEPLWFMAGYEKVCLEQVVVIDALRNLNQVHPLDEATRGIGRSATFIHMGPANPVEPGLFEECDERILTGYGDPAGQALGVLERILGPSGADCVIGAQWGSEGKGKVAAWLASSPDGESPYAAMGRSGGPNAGHRVELLDGSYFVFRHLPSATPYAASGTALCIGPGAVIDLEVLKREICHIPKGCTLFVDPRVAIVDENARQAERDASLTDIGSTMTGSGGAMALRVLRKAVTVEDYAPSGSFGLSLGAYDPRMVQVAPVGTVLREAMCRGRVLLESTQGMQLSLLHGNYPHVTGRDVSPISMLAEMGLPPGIPCRWFLVARTYPIRVAGPSGDLPCETTWEEVAHTSGIDVDKLRESERTSVTKRLRRVARWDNGSLIRTVRRGFGFAEQVFVVITFADYLSATASGREDLKRILAEAAAVSRDGDVLVGDGPRTSQLTWLHTETVDHDLRAGFIA